MQYFRIWTHLHLIKAKTNITITNIRACITGKLQLKIPAIIALTWIPHSKKIICDYYRII